MTARDSVGLNGPVRCVSRDGLRVREVSIDGTDDRSHEEQNSMIPRYTAWRNRHADDAELRDISLRAKVA